MQNKTNKSGVLTSRFWVGYWIGYLRNSTTRFQILFQSTKINWKPRFFIHDIQYFTYIYCAMRTNLVTLEKRATYYIVGSNDPPRSRCNKTSQAGGYKRKLGVQLTVASASAVDQPASNRKGKSNRPPTWEPCIKVHSLKRLKLIFSFFKNVTGSLTFVNIGWN